MKLTPEDIARRRPVWAALSDLYLDTNHALSYDFIAGILANSGYESAEIEQIIRDEVGPVLYTNLLQVAGDWAGFPAEWVEREITHYLEQPAPLRAATQIASMIVTKDILNTDWPRLRALAWGQN